MLSEIRARASAVPAEWRVHVVSENNFPTAAGLASSAAGYACLTAALAEAYGVKDTYPGEVSTIARMGSGSACRSLYGGFVKWEAGVRPDGTDSIAVQVAPEDHWPDLQVLILVVSANKKETSSTAGMMTSVETSELLKFRAEAVVPARMAAISEAYLAKDFEAFGRITMQDSNQFHACCADTYPPIFYMNDVSRSIVASVHAINAAAGAVKAAYTFDAGPNAVIYVRKEDVPNVLSVLLHHFPHDGDIVTPEPDMVRAATDAAARGDVPEPLRRAADMQQPGVLTQVYHTTVGAGAAPLAVDKALADPVTGMPLPRGGD